MSKSLTNQDLKKLSHRFQVAFALFCAKQVIHLTDNKETHKCVKFIELWLDGKATSEQCDAAYAYAAYPGSLISTTYSAAHAHAAAVNAICAARSITNTDYAAAAVRAAADAADAADTAAAATNAATNAAYVDTDIRKAQWVFYIELLEFDTVFEKVVLA